jgi:hypothetical protein
MSIVGNYLARTGYYELEKVIKVMQNVFVALPKAILKGRSFEAFSWVAAGLEEALL